ncbi:MAG: glycosyltransferase family 1 protein [Pyrinomonadaceae bacterium]
MHIAIDAHSIGTELAGNETYAANLIKALAEIDTSNRYTLYVTTPEAVARFKDRWSHVAVRRTLPHTPLVRIPVTLSAELRRRPVDLLHVQYTSPPLAPCPVVATIHDLSFEHLPETFKRRSRAQMRLTIRRTAKNAAHIITPSEFTRRDINKTYNINAEKITAIPLAADVHFHPVADTQELTAVKQRYGIETDYILAVGSIQPRKNLARLIEAYARLHHTPRAARLPKLVIVGKRAWLYEETLRAAHESGVHEQIIFTGYAPQEDLPALYTGAMCFVYPSVFEGFGLPPLEAMRCGTPVIVGDKTSLPEVVGDAGISFNPFDTDELAAVLERLIADEKLRRSLSARGLERARLFGWCETARQTLAVYEKVARVKRTSSK